MAFNGGAGIHGIDPGEYSSIGHDASHGCMRMRIPDVISLYARTPVGTPVSSPSPAASLSRPAPPSRSSAAASAGSRRHCRSCRPDTTSTSTSAPRRSARSAPGSRSAPMRRASCTAWDWPTTWPGWACARWPGTSADGTTGGPCCEPTWAMPSSRPSASRTTRCTAPTCWARSSARSRRSGCTSATCSPRARRPRRPRRGELRERHDDRGRPPPRRRRHPLGRPRGAVRPAGPTSSPAAPPTAGWCPPSACVASTSRCTAQIWMGPDAPFRPLLRPRAGA